MLAPNLRLAPLTILKAAHHGSATSSSEEFIDAVAPAAVIFSAGKNNTFRHPAPVVVRRFSQRGIPAFNTADDGAVFVETDGYSIDIRGWRMGRRLSITKDTKDITKDTKGKDTKGKDTKERTQRKSTNQTTKTPNREKTLKDGG
jgi:hypothetical protein